MTDSSEIAYNASEVAGLLNIKLSTLRKYAIMLEDEGYKFHRNESGHRGYFNKDVMMLKQFIKIKDQPDMTLKQAKKAVITRFKSDDMTPGDTSEGTSEERHNARYITKEEFEVFQEQQKNFQEQLLKKLDEQSSIMQDRDKKLMETMNHVMESKQLLLESKKEAQEQNNKKWWQFWK